MQELTNCSVNVAWEWLCNLNFQYYYMYNTNFLVCHGCEWNGLLVESMWMLISFSIFSIQVKNKEMDLRQRKIKFKLV